MIINLRGTSGSGKTTLARAVMDTYEARHPVFVPGRKQPLCYRLFRRDEDVESGTPELVVLGHYEATCGGCDTLPKMTMPFDFAAEAHAMLGCHVLFEGLLIGLDMKHTLALSQDVGAENLLVIHLDVPLEVCIASVNVRRAERDVGPVDPVKTTAKWHRTRACAQKLLTAGVRVEHHDREAALARVLEVLS